MQTDLLDTLGLSRTTVANRITLSCEQLEVRVTPSATPLVVVAPAGASYAVPTAVAPSTSHAAGTASLDAVFAAPAAAPGGLSDAAYAQALQTHPAAVLQDFAAGAANVTTAAATTRSSTTTLTASAQTVPAGQSVTLTATVTAPGLATKPGGTVTFKDGTTTLGTAALVNGVASFVWKNPAAGSHKLTAAYGGGGTVQASTSAAVSVTVTASKATTQLATPYASNAKPTSGSPFSLYASLNILTAGTTATPGGTITFKDGATVLGTVPLNPKGRTELALSGLSAGTHTITEVYSGDAHFAGATSAALSLTVSPSVAVKTAVRLTAPALSVSPATAGAPLTFAVSYSLGAASAYTPTGNVTFKDGSTVLGTVPLNAHGQTSFTVSGLAAGTHSITAVYSGDAHFLGATSAATTLTVSSPGKAAVQVTLEDVGNVTTADHSLMFLVTVKSASGTPGGLVMLKDGSMLLGEIDLDGRGEAALARGIGLPAGKHTITATYEGSANFATGSTSLTLTLS